MEFRYTKGQRLVIKLTNQQELEGDCEKCAKDRIDITNIIEYPNCEILKDSLSYYRCEIASVHVKQEDEKQTESIQLTKEVQVPAASKAIALSQDEYDRLKNMTTKYIYLPKMDDQYLKATNCLSNCENIAVFGVGCKLGQMKKINLLVLSSWQQVYIFDLLLYSEKDLPLALKTILESKQIKKVVYDSRALFDCLWHCYKVKLSNIFDTHVANIRLQKTQTACELEKTRNLQECLEHYLNFPSTFLEKAMEVSLKEWKERPLDELKKIKASQLVGYLITLKNAQEKVLLKGFYGVVAEYSQVLAKSDDYTAQKILSSQEVITEEIKKLL